MTILSEVFYICLLTTLSGVLIKLASMAYKSKCKECSICCLKIVRDVDLEEKELEFRIKNNRKEEEEKNSV